MARTRLTVELQRRFEREGLDAIAVAAHPGWTGTDLQRNAWYMRTTNVLFAMSPARGALATLRAATAPDVKGGEYCGPHGYREMRGYPVKVATSDDAKSAEDAARLWQVSEEATGIIMRPACPTSKASMCPLRWCRTATTRGPTL
jgi:hypothetical protein